MSGKTRENRFTILFNLGDPMQKSAVDTLNAMGHSKAKYIATAIYYWQHNGAPPDLSLEMTSKIEEALEALLIKKGIVDPLPSAPSAHQAAPRSKPQRHATLIKPDEDEAEVPARFLAAINAFKPHNP